MISVVPVFCFLLLAFILIEPWRWRSLVIWTDRWNFTFIGVTIFLCHNWLPRVVYLLVQQWWKQWPYEETSDQHQYLWCCQNIFLVPPYFEVPTTWNVLPAISMVPFVEHPPVHVFLINFFHALNSFNLSHLFFICVLVATIWTMSFNPCCQECRQGE